MLINTKSIEEKNKGTNLSIRGLLGTKEMEWVWYPSFPFFFLVENKIIEEVSL